MQFGVDSGDIAYIIFWLGRVWPIAAPLMFLLILRKKIHRPIAFVVFGSLACSGIYSIVGQILISMPWSTPASSSVSEKVSLLIAAAISRTLIASIIISIPMLYWLYKAYASIPPNNALNSQPPAAGTPKSGAL